MGLADLNFTNLIPGATGFGLNADPVAALDYLGDSTNQTQAYKDAIARFSTKLDGSNWYQIFPYQFLIVDTNDIQDVQTFEDLNPPPVQPTPTPLLPTNGTPSADSLSPYLDTTALLNQVTQAANDQAQANYVKQMSDWQAKKKASDAVNAQEEDANATKILYTLPIPPDALNLKPIFAQRATPTLSGVVEETSENVFWMITLSGTTGIAIGRDDTTSAAQVFRDRISTTGLLSGLGAALDKLGSTVTNIGNAIDGLSSADSFQTGAAGVADLAQAALLPKLPYSQSAVDQNRNGYLEMHLLHRFLVAYGGLKAKRPLGLKLYFINQKDGQQFRCIIEDFQIQKSVNEPYLYRYRISLKGWDLKDPAEAQGEAIDRFKTDLAPVNTTTLTNLVGSLNNLVANSIGNPSNIIPVVL